VIEKPKSSIFQETPKEQSGPNIMVSKALSADMQFGAACTDIKNLKNAIEKRRT
jgi:hypothetical protein